MKNSVQQTTKYICQQRISAGTVKIRTSSDWTNPLKSLTGVIPIKFDVSPIVDSPTKTNGTDLF